VALRSSPSSLPDIEKMKIGEIRSELESYGISTKSFLEKKEMVAALEKARKEGLRPKKAASTASSSTAENQSARSASASSSSSKGQTSSAGAGGSRDDRIKEEMGKASGMSVSDLKKELGKMGVSTKSFFEKSEFVRAYAEAVVDGVGVNGNRREAGGGSSQSASDDEPYDPEYRDVVMQKMGKSDPRLLQGTVIDIRLNRR
jgi:hypothetical protein